MVAGEDAQAAGVLRQHLGDAELGGEVGDAGGASAPSDWYQRGVVRYSSRSSTASCRRRTNLRSVASCARRSARDLTEDLDRVPAAALPQRRVERLEEIPRLRVPGPAKVPHQLGEGRQRLGRAARTVNRRSARTGRD